MAGEVAWQLRDLVLNLGSQPPVTPTPGDLVSYAGLLGSCIHNIHILTDRHKENLEDGLRLDLSDL